MGSGPHVLVISHDEMLLHTRKLLLGTYFQVETAGRVIEAEALVEKQPFNLIVLCYSLSAEECRHISILVNSQQPPPKILILNSGGHSCARPPGRVELTIENGPYALLKKSAEMLDFDLKAKGRTLHS